MKLHIVARGKLGRSPEAELLTRYAKLGLQAALAGNDLPLLLGAATARVKALRTT